MPFTVLVGLQWGDEGKGKIADYLSGEFGIVARFQGGANAGHTVNIGKKNYVLHLLPTGLLRQGTKGGIGAGVAVDLGALCSEIKVVEKASGPLRDRLIIDERAQLVLPFHKLEDKRLEESDKAPKIGTTQRGIGPSYRDRYARYGVRIGLLKYPELLTKAIERSLSFNNPILECMFGQSPFSVQEVIDSVEPFRDEILPYLGDLAGFLWEHRNEKVLLEGAQGTLLDVNFGTYPFVTSSHCIAGAAAVGLGIPPYMINRIIGITKAYTTRVGEGPFPTEMDEEMNSYIREKGGEYGAATGRPRRCGWLDLPALRYAVRLNGATEIMMTKLDVFSGLPEVQVAVAYQTPTGKTKDFPIYGLESVKPIYKSMKGWGIFTGERIPHEALEFIKMVEEEVGVPVTLLSYGSDRAEVIKRRVIAEEF
ncbi:MAG: adenylosuccinate synthase [candidate division WOR-3 bacterium]